MSVTVTIDPDCIGDLVDTLQSMPSAKELQERIEAALPGAEVSVEDLTGGGDHFRAEVVSERFEGLSRIQQHQLVYGVFGAEVGGPIHALSIKTAVPKQPARPAAHGPDKPGATA
jgi:stress-induced morphogen